MKYVYLLGHSHNIDGEEDDVYETKIIGVYSSKGKAQKKIKIYRKIEGFEKYPDDFYIDKYEVDKDHWTEGFISFDEMDESIK